MSKAPELYIGMCNFAQNCVLQYTKIVYFCIFKNTFLDGKTRKCLPHMSLADLYFSTHRLAGIPHSCLAVDNIEMGFGHKIPLWLFGFLY